MGLPNTELPTHQFDLAILPPPEIEEAHIVSLNEKLLLAKGMTITPGIATADDGKLWDEAVASIDSIERAITSSKKALEACKAHYKSI